MQQHSPRDDQASEPLIRRLDRAADGINPFLLILMVGLVILIAIRVTTMGLANLPITRVDPRLPDFTRLRNRRCQSGQSTWLVSLKVGTA
jgi:hypothetical protein